MPENKFKFESLKLDGSVDSAGVGQVLQEDKQRKTFVKYRGGKAAKCVVLMESVNLTRDGEAICMVAGSIGKPQLDALSQAEKDLADSLKKSSIVLSEKSVPELISARDKHIVEINAKAAKEQEIAKKKADAERDKKRKAQKAAE